MKPLAHNLLPLSSSKLYIIILTASIDQSPLKLPKKMNTLNTTRIKQAYSKLMRTIRKELKSVDLDTTDFYEHIVLVFEPEEISRLIPDSTAAKNIDRTFETLTKARCWGFGDVSKLKSIVEEFIKDEDGNIQQMISDYNIQLTAYNATTKIIEKIASKEIQEGCEDDDDDDDDESEGVTLDASKYNQKFRKKLSAKLFKAEDDGKVKLTMKSLDYIGKFWEEICKVFDMSLSCVLDQIAEGCIEITWHIPSPSAQRILTRIESTVQFLQRKFVSNIILEDIVIYSESCGVATQKVR